MSTFDWQRHPGAERFLLSLLEENKERNTAIRRLEHELSDQTSTRLFDWIDHFTINASRMAEQDLESHGFEQECAMPTYRVFTHPGAKFPSVLLRDETSKHLPGLSIKVESIADFLMVRGLQRCIEGSFYSSLRTALVAKEKNTVLRLLERRGSRTMEPVYAPESELSRTLAALERWQTRPRFDDEEECWSQATIIAEEMVATIGKDAAATLVLECERKYWQAKNRAAQIQKNRQDRLGMGWANHDHHTFRSSRLYFSRLVRLFETLGFHCRERFYAGHEAGWGAQVMESFNAGLVLFLDVDLTPDEVAIDFAHQPLEEKSQLGTVGLWCALHGESILQAGMHHLEAQFDFDKLKQDLTHYGVDMMAPFSQFSFLHQAFTKGEVWPVAPERIERLLKRGSLSHEQADRFLQQGAIGSHLENLQRAEGYKGFNKQGVSAIIQKTDPRITAA